MNSVSLAEFLRYEATRNDQMAKLKGPDFAFRAARFREAAEMIEKIKQEE